MIRLFYLPQLSQPSFLRLKNSLYPSQIVAAAKIRYTTISCDI
jgi:hypothetical protein